MRVRAWGVQGGCIVSIVWGMRWLCGLCACVCRGLGDVGACVVVLAVSSRACVRCEGYGVRSLEEYRRGGEGVLRKGVTPYCWRSADCVGWSGLRCSGSAGFNPIEVEKGRGEGVVLSVTLCLPSGTHFITLQHNYYIIQE